MQLARFPEWALSGRSQNQKLKCLVSPLGQSFRVLRGREKIPLPDNLLNTFLGIKETQIVKEQFLESCQQTRIRNSGGFGGIFTLIKNTKVQFCLTFTLVIRIHKIQRPLSAWSQVQKRAQIYVTTQEQLVNI